MACRLHDACQFTVCSTLTDPTVIQSVAQHGYFFIEFKESKMFSITCHTDSKRLADPGWNIQHVSQVVTVK